MAAIKDYPINPTVLAGIERYEKRWYQLLEDFEVTNATNATKWWNILVSAYAGQKHRCFHNEDWLWGMLNSFEELSWTSDFFDDEEAQMALWFVRFDINPNRDRFSQRVECLQAVAQCMGDLGIDPERTKNVCRFLVNHPQLRFTNEAYMAYHDAVRWWWGRAPNTYAAAVALLQEEMGHMDDLEFIEWRMPMLENALSHLYIFQTDRYRDNYEVQAQMNLANELMDYKRVTSILVSAPTSSSITAS